uniref:Uncharacterized protein n=1 Tax=Onchocerca volvulus TaxID=6282 RepID=A0A8R1TYC8_ONCVO
MSRIESDCFGSDQIRSGRVGRPKFVRLEAVWGLWPSFAKSLSQCGRPRNNMLNHKEKNPSPHIGILFSVVWQKDVSFRNYFNGELKMKKGIMKCELTCVNFPEQIGRSTIQTGRHFPAYPGL